jgi:hypothetical protein
LTPATVKVSSASPLESFFLFCKEAHAVSDDFFLQIDDRCEQNINQKITYKYKWGGQNYETSEYKA